MGLALGWSSAVADVRVLLPALGFPEEGAAVTSHFLKKLERGTPVVTIFNFFSFSLDTFLGRNTLLWGHLQVLS